MEIFPEEKPYEALFNNFIRDGEITWLGIREKAHEPMSVLEETYANIGGLTGDRANKGNPESKRQVTMIQYEHLEAVASFLEKETIDPALVRRNIVVKGLNLNALKGQQFIVGEAVLEMTGFCHPCNRMEENLGSGGFNAMRGHGGITCRVIKEGKIKLGDSVKVIPVSINEKLSGE
jgi:MOSC domain-containing protein YiiM